MLRVDQTAPGGWLAATAPGRLVVVRAPEDSAHLIERLWTALAGGIQPVLDVLTAGGLTATPGFALVEWSGDATRGFDVRFIVRGAAKVEVVSDGGARTIDASRVSTWLEQPVSDVRSFRIECDGAGEGAAAALPLGLGAVWVRSIAFGSDVEPQDAEAELAEVELAATEPATTAISAPAVAAPSSPAPPAAAAPARFADVTVVEPFGADEHGADEHGADEHGADEHGADEHGADEHGADEHGADEHGADEHGADEHATDELGAEEHDADEPDVDDTDADDSGAAERPAQRDASATADQPDAASAADDAPTGYDHLFGATVMRSVEEAAVRPADEEADSPAESPATHTISPPPFITDAGAPAAGDHDGFTVLSGDINALRASRQSEGGPSVPAPAAPAPTPPAAPAFHLRLAGGAKEPLAGTVIVGRAPSVSKVPGTQVPHLVTVDTPDHDISRNHVQFALEGDTVVVTDLHSRNGTMIVLPGKSPQKLRQGEPTSVIVGTLVDLGGGVTLTVGQE